MSRPRPGGAGAGGARGARTALFPGSRPRDTILRVSRDALLADPALAGALLLADRIHAGQKEKSSGAPYIGHPIRVATTVLAAGGTTTQVRAALLHDTIEDGGPRFWPEVAAFGADVAAIVRDCTDDEPQGGRKRAWLDRKVEHVAKLRSGLRPDSYLVVAADKLDAVVRTVADLERQGSAVWSGPVFKGGRLGTVWYYRSMTALVSRALPAIPIAEVLVREVARLTDLAGLGAAEVESLLPLAIETPWPDGIRAGQGGPG